MKNVLKTAAVTAISLSIFACQTPTSNTQTAAVPQRTVDSLNLEIERLKLEQLKTELTYELANLQAEKTENTSATKSSNTAYNAARYSEARPVAYLPATQTIEQRKKMDEVTKGALIGAGVGAATGAVIAKKPVKGAVLGGVLGAGAGAAAGKVIKDRKANYGWQ